MTNNCENCVHHKVCRFSDISKRIRGRITILFCEIEKEFKDYANVVLKEDLNAKEQFQIKIKCKDFELEIPKTREEAILCINNIE